MDYIKASWYISAISHFPHLSGWVRIIILLGLTSLCLQALRLGLSSSLCSLLWPDYISLLVTSSLLALALSEIFPFYIDNVTPLLSGVNFILSPSLYSGMDEKIGKKDQQDDLGSEVEREALWKKIGFVWHLKTGWWFREEVPVLRYSVV